ASMLAWLGGWLGPSGQRGDRLLAAAFTTVDGPSGAQEPLPETPVLRRLPWGGPISAAPPWR
ncbi:MAG: hypothetical protein ACKO8I_18790, partial [Cyanobacteriota bacterium]